MVKLGYTYKGRPIGASGYTRMPPTQFPWGKLIVFLIGLLIVCGIFVVLIVGGWDLFQSAYHKFSGSFSTNNSGTEASDPEKPVAALGGEGKVVETSGGTKAVRPRTQADTLYHSLYQTFRAGQYAVAQEKARELLSMKNIPEAVRARTELVLGRCSMALYYGEEASSKIQPYVVKPGDNYSRIANANETSVESLLLINNRNAGEILRSGETLKIYKGKWSIRFDQEARKMYLFDDGKLFKVYPIALQDRINSGSRFLVREKYKDKASGTQPGNRWLEFRMEGQPAAASPVRIELHGMDLNPRSNSRVKLAGFFRVSNQDMDELYAVVPRGTPMELDRNHQN